MATPVTQKLDFGNARRITNLAAGAANGEPVVYEQLQAAIEGLAWKDDVKAAMSTNVNLASPGATIDGVTMAAGDRFLVVGQTTTNENGIYVWNGAAVAATRAVDMNASAEFNSAIIPVKAGGTANGGTTWRCSTIDPVVGTTAISITSFQSAAPAATETISGIAEIATQAETDAGTDDTRIVTPLKLATYVNRKLKFAINVGDGTATSITVTHNLNTKDVVVQIYEVGGTFRQVYTEVQHTNVNSITLLFDTAPTAAQYRCVVIG
jgi:hypothetical protein